MTPRKFARLTLAILPAVAIATPIAAPKLALAAPITITTNTFDDPADGVCDGTPNKCSIRAAIQKANGDTGDTVQLQAGTYLLQQAASDSDNGANGDLEIVANMTIQGAGAALTKIMPAGEWNDRIIELDDGNAVINDLTVTGGNDLCAFDECDGGGIFNDGLALTLHNVVVDNNFTLGAGGGVASESPQSTTITNSTLSNNVADGNGGGLLLDGSTSGASVFFNLFVHDNTARNAEAADNGGGGIYNGLRGTGSAAFDDMQVINNHATGMNGGGIYDDSGFNSNSPVNYTNLTIAGNDARNIGGGVYVAFGRVTMTNATITGNSVTFNNVDVAGFGRGGGVGLGRSGGINLNNNTINGNSSPKAGGGIALIGASDFANLHNTLVVNNSGANVLSNCYITPGNSSEVVSKGYNIANDMSCVLTGTGDREGSGSGFDPQLQPLADNTGPTDGAPGSTYPTKTEALPKGSIAIDTADPTNSNNPAVDERHVTRPQGPVSDVGAYEYIPVQAQGQAAVPLLPKAGRSQAAATWQAEFAAFALLLLASVGAMLVLANKRT